MMFFNNGTLRWSELTFCKPKLQFRYTKKGGQLSHLSFTVFLKNLLIRNRFLTFCVHVEHEGDAQGFGQRVLLGLP